MASKEELLNAVPEGTTVHQTSDLEYGQEWESERTLQHAVLRYLSRNGPTRWDELFIHLTQYAPGKIAPALRHLAQWMHITVEGGDILKISAFGAARLSGLPRA